ncbi:MAG: LD-carboxypeptidase [Prevotella sp.]|nr:LD-carboxypeptidase [Prevotella sp.]MCM1074345.1 LD-carboxypeptidase [Ruminococcus sp.]
MIYPRRLQRGDTVAFISPASTVRAEYVHGAAERLREHGYKVRIMPHALGGACGSYAATAEERLADFKMAWSDPDVCAIICTRGGYGTVHWIGDVSDSFLQATPKWLVGFSDVSALHARLLKAGIASVHGSMARYISDDERVLDALLKLMESEKPKFEYTAAAEKPGSESMSAEGVLKGGNLAVLSHLIGTPYDIFTGENKILFIEDISEAIYATERILWQLHSGGVLKRANGLIIGTFTDSRADKNFPDTKSMIYTRLKEWGYLDKMPVAFGFEIGHIPGNLPLIEGVRVQLTCNSTINTLKTIE